MRTNEKTKKLLGRALDYLIELDISDDETIEINNKKYSEVTMSAQQVIDAMHELALPDEAPITSRSSFRKDSKGNPNDYLMMLEAAKNKLNQKEIENKNISVSKSTNIAQLQLENVMLVEENITLKDNLKTCNFLINQLDKDTREKPINNIIITQNASHTKILKSILDYHSRMNTLIITPKKGRVPSLVQILDHVSGEFQTICELNDVSELISHDTILES